jgi:hypothetical protein
MDNVKSFVNFAVRNSKTLSQFIAYVKNIRPFDRGSRNVNHIHGLDMAWRES